MEGCRNESNVILLMLIVFLIHSRYTNSFAYRIIETIQKLLKYIVNLSVV